MTAVEEEEAERREGEGIRFEFEYYSAFGGLGLSVELMYNIEIYANNKCVHL